MNTTAIEFSCNGKCRICPYPGANCKTITLKPHIPDRSEKAPEVLVSKQFQDEFFKMKHM